MGSYNSINFTKLIVNGIPYDKAYVGSKILFGNNNPFTLEITGYKDGNDRASLYYRKGSNTQENCTFYITCGNNTYTKHATNTTGSYLKDDNNNRVYFYSGDKIKIKVVYDNNDTPVVGSNIYGAGIALSGCYYKVYGDLSTYNANSFYSSMLSTGNSGVAVDGLTDISGIMWSDTVSQFCYYYMFYGQSNLAGAVDLPATTLAFRCYTRMFYHTGVTDITMHALDYSSQDVATASPGGFNQFVMTDTQPTNGGVFRLPAGNNLAQFSSIEGKAPDASDQKWTILIDYSKKYFTIQSLVDNNTITFTKYNQKSNYVTADKPIQYSKDLTTWNNISFVTDNSSQIVLNSGEKLYLKGTNSAYGEKISSNLTSANIQSSGNIDVMGNVMSLIYGDNFIGNNTISATHTFASLFRNNNKLINAKDLVLPAMSLTQECYNSMFSGCTSLTTAPELPATTLSIQCYNSMFNGCTSLTTAPALPATTLADYCYSSMFSGCTSLVTAPALPATTLAARCYYFMFRKCNSLTTAPELPATTLTDYCYYYMFNSCTSLNYVKAMFTSTTQSNYKSSLDYWLNSVSSTGTFVKNSEATWANSECGIPSGWTVTTASA